jgi:hypothetical protein
VIHIEGSQHALFLIFELVWDFLMVANVPDQVTQLPFQVNR